MLFMRGIKLNIIDICMICYCGVIKLKYKCNCVKMECIMFI